MTGLAACESPDPELVPDDLLQTRLGLTPDDRVHTVWISAGAGERADPLEVTVRPGDYVQFVSADWMVHEFAFELEGLRPDARDFLERTGQDASPPLVARDARFVVSFESAPPGVYRYTLSGSRGDGGGQVIVTEDAR